MCRRLTQWAYRTLFNLSTVLMRVHQRKGFFERRLKLKCQQQVCCLVGIASRTKDFVFVLAKGF